MKNKYIFILTITFVCSLLLSLASEGLKSTALKNIEMDKKKNILSAVGIKIESMKVEEIDKYFFDNIDTIIVDIEGEFASELSIENLETVENNQSGEIKYYYNTKEYLPIYIEKQNNAIILPISGKGLWSTLYGYFSIDSNDYSTVKGITFYAHKETPGLGAEIEKEWFQSNFVGKQIYNNEKLVSIDVAKAGMADDENMYEVDGISGATITSVGVANLLERDLNRYKPYFEKNK